MRKRSSLLLTFILSVTLSLLGGYESSFAKLAASQPDFPNAKLLVSAASVQKNLHGIVLIDARTSGYETSHIPGAINLNYNDYLTPGNGLKDLATLQSKLTAAGLKSNSTIVIYDNTTASFGAAGRVFWMLEYLGCKDVHILDGGWDKWVADKRKTKSGIQTLRSKKAFVASVNASLLATSSHIMDRLTSLDATNSTDDFAVVDARTNEEYIGWQFYGEARGGHIPKAVNIPYEWFFNDDKTVLDYQDLRKLFEDRGVTADKEVTSYCTVGYTQRLCLFSLAADGVFASIELRRLNS